MSKNIQKVFTRESGHAHCISIAVFFYGANRLRLNSVFTKYIKSKVIMKFMLKILGNYFAFV